MRKWGGFTTFQSCSIRLTCFSSVVWWQRVMYWRQPVKSLQEFQFCQIFCVSASHNIKKTLWCKNYKHATIAQERFVKSWRGWLVDILMLSLPAVESSRRLHPPADTGACCLPNTVPERWICECHLRHWLAQRRTGKKNGYGAVRQRGRLKEKGIRNKTERGTTAAVKRTQSQPAQVAFHMKMLWKLSNYCTKWFSVWTD